MNFSHLDVLEDTRSNCFSIMTTAKMGEYLEFILAPYKEKGGIEEQREPLKTSSALRIRERMIDDISLGTILPPIVIGIISQEGKQPNWKEITPDSFSVYLDDLPKSNIMIIDGMQRTTALLAASDRKEIKKNNLRVEFWVARDINNLVYRMLVLNTGQVPWNLRRQIEVVFRSMISDIKKLVPDIDLITISDNNRRTQAGQFHANDVVELYLVFGSRKEKIDTKERLADEFTRLDFIQATEKDDFTKIFYEVLKYLARIDKVFGKFQQGEEDGRFNNGKDIFKSQPARVGYITATAKFILGRPGIDREPKEIDSQLRKFSTEVEKFINKIGGIETRELGDFLQLDLLNESLAKKSGRVGDFEREFFTKAFDTLLEERFEVPSLGVCWRAY